MTPTRQRSSECRSCRRRVSADRLYRDLVNQRSLCAACHRRLGRAKCSTCGRAFEVSIPARRSGSAPSQCALCLRQSGRDTGICNGSTIDGYRPLPPLPPLSPPPSSSAYPLQPPDDASITTATALAAAVAAAGANPHPLHQSPSPSTPTAPLAATMDLLSSTLNRHGTTPREGLPPPRRLLQLSPQSVSPPPVPRILTPRCPLPTPPLPSPPRKRLKPSSRRGCHPLPRDAAGLRPVPPHSSPPVKNRLGNFAQPLSSVLVPKPSPLTPTRSPSSRKLKRKLRLEPAVTNHVATINAECTPVVDLLSAPTSPVQVRPSSPTTIASPPPLPRVRRNRVPVIRSPQTQSSGGRGYQPPAAEDHVPPDAAQTGGARNTGTNFDPEATSPPEGATPINNAAGTTQDSPPISGAAQPDRRLDEQPTPTNADHVVVGTPNTNTADLAADTTSGAFESPDKAIGVQQGERALEPFIRTQDVERSPGAGEFESPNKSVAGQGGETAAAGFTPTQEEESSPSTHVQDITATAITNDVTPTPASATNATGADVADTAADGNVNEGQLMNIGDVQVRIEIGTGLGLNGGEGENMADFRSSFSKTLNSVLAFQHTAKQYMTSLQDNVNTMVERAKQLRCQVAVKRTLIEEKNRVADEKDAEASEIDANIRERSESIRKVLELVQSIEKDLTQGGD